MSFFLFVLYLGCIPHPCTSPVCAVVYVCVRVDLARAGTQKTRTCWSLALNEPRYHGTALLA